MKTLYYSAFMLLLTLTANAQDSDYKKYFLTEQECLKGMHFIPAPPAFNSVEFANDIYFYNWGKQQRETPRGQQAATDEVERLEKVYSEVIGFTISKEETPDIFWLAQMAVNDGTRANRNVKNHYKRTRPFAYFNEPSLVSQDDDKERSTFSYPSGHTIRGWMYALTLACVVPDSTDVLINRAREYGLSRVICGRHYKSDVDASLILASAVFSRLNSCEAFQEQLKKARKEYAKLRKN